MRNRAVNRRRALRIIAGTAASTFCIGRAQAERFEWSGIALGADARLVLDGHDRQRAGIAVAQCRAEVARLEAIFSLYQADSEIRRLNRDGALGAPSLDMVALLRNCRGFHRQTEGLFDPTVQPLWAYYAGLAPAAMVDDRTARMAIASLLPRVGMGRVEIGHDRIVLPEGAGITLNGVAQGYITECVSQILRRLGWTRVLVDMGEVAVPGEEPFDIEVRETQLRLPLASAALATSSDELVFPGATGVGHIVSPSNGMTPRFWRAVTVRHPSATTADALSTALFLAEPGQFQRILTRFPGATAWRVRPDGTNEAA